MARERLERTVRLEADIRTQSDQRLEVRGVSTEIYHDAKRAAGVIPRLLGRLRTSRLLLALLISLIGAGVSWGLFVALILMPISSGGVIGISVGIIGCLCLLAWLKLMQRLLDRVWRN